MLLCLLMNLINVGNFLHLYERKCKGLIHILDRNVFNNFFLKGVNCLIYEEHVVNFGYDWIKQELEEKESPNTWDGFRL